MTRRLGLLLLSALFFPMAVFAGDPAFTGRWRLEIDPSSKLDGWSAMDLVVATDGPRVALRYDMTWRTTKVTAVNTLNTDAPVDISDFFRIDQRHMAVYARPGLKTRVWATWVDGGRTLQMEAKVPVEVSQGDRIMRIYDEFRLMEGNGELELIELHSTRDRPLVYYFRKISGTGVAAAP